MLDEFLTEFSPQEIEALDMPTLEEVRAAVDTRGTQCVQRSLATNTGWCHQVMLEPCFNRNLHEIWLTMECIDRPSPALNFPVHLQVHEKIKAGMGTLRLILRSPRPAQAWTRPRPYVRN